MPNGFWDRILHVDLTTGSTRIEHLGADFWRTYLGGRALVGHYLLTEVPADADPLGPENVLVFAAGVLTGTPVPGAARHSVGARSPMTGGYGESEAGGFWGAELRMAGWDGIVLHGRAEKPVYLWIKDDAVEIRDASHLWGKETGAVEDAVRAELGDRRVRVAQTGIAGENLVKFAVIAHDLKEFAGRGGMGAVMGSKNLKAVVVRGSRKLPLADPAPHQRVAKWVVATMDEKHNRHHYYGTGVPMKGKHIEGHLIVHNFQDGQWESVTKIDAKAVKDAYGQKQDGCYACSVRCKKRVLVQEPERYATDPRYGGPEYETLAAFGTNLTIDNLAALCRMNQRLTLLGVDCISMGSAIGWATECFERGLLTEQDTGGLTLRWGDPDPVLELIERTARKQGFGALLAEGTLAAARAIGRGTERYVVHVKGLELGMHDPRALPESLDNYVVCPVGGDHTGSALPRIALRNTVGLCQFLQYDDATILDLIHGATGWQLEVADLRATIARGLTMARLFNLRAGFTRADDRLPDRMFESIRTGPMSDRRLTQEDVLARVLDYYQTLGWDEEGVPRPETLAALGLQRYAPVPEDTVGVLPPLAQPRPAPVAAAPA